MKTGNEKSVIIAAAVLIVAMVASVAANMTPVYPLVLGLGLFSWIAFRGGFSIAEIIKMCIDGLCSAKVVLIMMLLIGMLTGSWRISGTIGYFVYYGIKLIRPWSFILIAFILSSILSYAVGSSYAVAASAGVIFMSLAKAGGVNELITAGTIMSGIYVGDRGALASSSAMLVASVTETDHISNVKRMLVTGALPFIVSLVLYIFYSVTNPISSVDDSFVAGLENMFSFSFWCILPALIILILPLAGIAVWKAMVFSIITATGVAIIEQNVAATDIVKTMITGYASPTEFGRIFNGGGVLSMINVILIVAISGMYAGIFNKTGMLNGIRGYIGKLMDRTGKFFATCCVGLLLSAIACNQSFPTVMSGTLFSDLYSERGASKEELASDMQNSFIVAVGLIPWTAASSGPLLFMGASPEALKYAFYLFLIPVIYGIGKRQFFRKDCNFST